MWYNYNRDTESTLFTPYIANIRIISYAKKIAHEHGLHKYFDQN